MDTPAGSNVLARGILRAGHGLQEAASRGRRQARPPPLRAPSQLTRTGKARWRESGTPSSDLYLKVVIDDSVPWKIELLRIADRLEKRQSQKRWPEQSFSLAERDIMFAAYIIRKLIEANKLSDDVTGREIVVIEHPLSGRAPDIMSYERIWENYDLQAGVECVLSLRDLCNQVIHSFNWTIVRYEHGGLGGIFVSSDRARRKILYFVDIVLLVVILREVGYDDVVEIQMKRDTNGQMQVISLLGADTRTTRYEWLMTSRSHRE
jgi:hypothetical protein